VGHRAASLPRPLRRSLTCQRRVYAYYSLTDRPCHSILKYMVHKLLNPVPQLRPSITRLQQWRRRVEGMCPELVAASSRATPASHPAAEQAAGTAVADGPARKRYSASTVGGAGYRGDAYSCSSVAHCLSSGGCSCATPEAASAVPDGKKPRATPHVAPSSASATDVPRDTDDAAPAPANAADPSKPASASPARAAAWESVPGLHPDRAAVASPPHSRSVHQRRAIASLSQRLRELLGDPNVPHQGDTAADSGLPTAWVANRHAGRLLVYLRLSLERLLSADGLAALEAYVEACGPNPPVRTTPGGSVVLVGAGNRRGDPVQAFHAACRILPTFSPRELATDIIPTVHALHRWESLALAQARRREE